MSSVFNADVNEFIKDCMANLEGNCSSPFAEISRLTNYAYSASRIYHHWHNNLNWCLCHDPLTQGEKNYIDVWVCQHRLPNGEIRWTVLQKEMQQVFLKLHNTNKIKNYWRSNQHRTLRTANTSVQNGGNTNLVPLLPPSVLLNNGNNSTSASPTAIPFILGTSRPSALEPSYNLSEPQFNMPYKMRPFF
ncbi:17531_t:CDS:2 [Funneliformis geosporum]|uniref:9253_t:CDS:1 n=1 Tax=Funneliformis geosporum TaxID=1117311 RepID=A0A9W4SKQ0_9GLOM|nr:9253_t:CDS:2 [Funneliformis geosporum]CAI2185921.1 17531_t:CDS:2 [Funneliformis geosporum]